MKFLKKHCFLILIVALSLCRFLLSFHLESFYIYNFRCDDKLMINLLNFMKKGEYLGAYNHMTIIKGMVFPFLLYLINSIHISYSVMFTFIHIACSFYFVSSFKKIINHKMIFIILYFILLFNPVSYSSELFQRLYRNTLAVPELLLFFGTVIRILSLKKNDLKAILYYILLGIICTLMYLTKEDNIWVLSILLILFIYKIYKERKIKAIFINFIPVISIFVSLNFVSFINYKHYHIYTYNELSHSEFKNAYLKLLKIKDAEKIEKVAIPKSTFYQLAEHSKSFGITKEEIDKWYQYYTEKNGEISNSNIIWKFRDLIYSKFRFESGKEANQYFYNLSVELDELFEKGVFEKEWTLPSIFINPPTLQDIKQMPKSFLDAIVYTSSYEEIKTIPSSYFNGEKYNRKMIYIQYDDEVKAYGFGYSSTHETGNIIDENPIIYEVIRVFYQYFTILCSIPCFVIYLINIRKKDQLNVLLHMMVVSYLIILGGVVYTHVTAFDAIRYCYLGNIYILQSIFILLNMIRLYTNKEGNLI